MEDKEYTQARILRLFSFRRWKYEIILQGGHLAKLFR